MVGSCAPNASTADCGEQDANAVVGAKVFEALLAFGQSHRAIKSLEWDPALLHCFRNEVENFGQEAENEASVGVKKKKKKEKKKKKKNRERTEQNLYLFSDWHF